MATDAILRDVVEQIKKTILFLEKLTKLDKKLKPDKDALLKELNATVQRCTATLGGTAEGAGETYDDVSVADAAKDSQADVYDDVGDQGMTYDDVNGTAAGAQPPSSDDVYDDTDNPAFKPAENLSMDSPIVDTPCDKLQDSSIAEYVELKKEGGLAKLIKSAWQKRYCVVHRGIMYMYESPKDKKQKEAFRTKGFEFKAREDITKEGKRKERCFELRNESKVYEFCAPDKKALKQWSLVFGGSGGSIASGSIGGGGDTYDDAGLTYDDTTQGNDVYEDTAGQNYDDTTIGADLEPPGDIYEDTDVAPTPALPQRRPSARDELPKPPTTASRPGMPVPNKLQPLTPMSGRPPPTLPPREESGSASGTLSRPPMLPPPPHSPLRNLPEPPQSAASQHSPNLPPPPMDDAPKPDDFPDDIKDDYINMYQGMWDCYADEDNELPFKRGEIIHILSRDYEDYGWWIAENTMEDIGLVPVSYVMKAYDV